MFLTNCSAGSTHYAAPVAAVLALSLTIHAVAVPHDFNHAQLPPQEHTELSSKSTAIAGIYAGGITLANSGSTLSSSSITFPVRHPVWPAPSSSS